MGKFIQKAIKRPGRMKRMAARKGISVHEAEVEASHSKDPSLRASGKLGLRFGKGGDLHKKKKHARKERESKREDRKEGRGGERREKKTGIHYSEA